MSSQRPLDTLKADLVAATQTPLEVLLVETLCAQWLQLQDAHLRASKHLHQYGYITQYHEQRLATATRLFESAAKTLAQVQKLLRPKAPVVNIAQQQIVNM